MKALPSLVVAQIQEAYWDRTLESHAAFGERVAAILIKAGLDQRPIPPVTRQPRARKELVE